jgi:D-alanine-D-alanine ligase
LRVAPGCVVDARAWAHDRELALSRCCALSSSGFAVKPDRGGSSVATTVLPGPDGLAAAIERVLVIGDRALVEARVHGRECTVACLGGPDEVRALTPVEIVPKDGRFFDYEEKYSTSGASEHCPPIGIDAATCTRLRQLGERAHRAAGCAGASRVDFIVPAEGDPVVLEINTLPGMTARSLLPLAARDAGLSFRELCLFLVGEALRAAPGSP